MAFDCKVILDSISPAGKRLTTITATYPRFIHSEIMTHRDRARNSASSRAIPWAKMRQQIIDDPVIPLVFGSEQKGMQTGGEVDDPATARLVWLEARDEALKRADELHRASVHKSLVNRIVEPWMWITVVMTATEWKNFFRLRCHPDAEIHFQKIAGMIRDALESSRPQQLSAGEWHLPFVTHFDQSALSFDRSINELKRISAARCARVSYLTHEGRREPGKDIDLFEKLEKGSGFGHWSPPEHVGEAMDDPTYRSGPFVGWKQFRKEFPLENSEG